MFVNLLFDVHFYEIYELFSRVDFWAIWWNENSGDFFLHEKLFNCDGSVKTAVIRYDNNHFSYFEVCCSPISSIVALKILNTLFGWMLIKSHYPLYSLHAVSNYEAGPKLCRSTYHPSRFNPSSSNHTCAWYFCWLETHPEILNENLPQLIQ